jgi:hypothetical protein
LSQPCAETELLAACRVLFGPGVRLSREFLHYLQPGGAKAAFRKKAKETHPDLGAPGDPDDRLRRAETFRELISANDLICAFLQQRQTQPAAPRSGPNGRTGRGYTTESFFRGRVPPRALEFGRYLYYRGCIPYPALIEAIAWQRGQRPSIGSIAQRWGWLSEEQTRQILRQPGMVNRFGGTAVQLGLLKPFQVQTLLYYQRSQQQRIGRFFIERNFLSEAQIEQLLADCRAHNHRYAAPRTDAFASRS